MSESLDRMTARHASTGVIRWIGLRPGRRETVVAVPDADITENGLRGDRRATPGKRAVTLIQWEHLPVIAALAGQTGSKATVDPALLRRNIAVAGVNLLALRKVRFRLGTAVLQGTGPCAPCTRMEEALGPGGFNAVRGHGGITAEVITPGHIKIGDALVPLA